MNGMSDEPKRRRRKRTWIGWALIAIALAGCSQSNEAHEAQLPDPAKITSMRAQWNGPPNGAPPGGQPGQGSGL